MKSLADFNRMEYFAHQGRVFRIVEMSNTHITCKSVMFCLDGSWHECDPNTFAFDLNTRVIPVALCPVPRKLWLATRSNGDRAVFTLIGAAKDWLNLDGTVTPVELLS